MEHPVVTKKKKKVQISKNETSQMMNEKTRPIKELKEEKLG